MLQPPHLQYLQSCLIDEATTWMHGTYSRSAVRKPKFCPLDSGRGGACSVESQSLWIGTWQWPVTALKCQQAVQVPKVFNSHTYTDLVRAHRKQQTEDWANSGAQGSVSFEPCAYTYFWSFRLTQLSRSKAHQCHLLVRSWNAFSGSNTDSLWPRADVFCLWFLWCV